MTNLINQLTELFTQYKTPINIAAGVLVFLLCYLLRRKLSLLILNIMGKIVFKKSEEKQNALKNSLIKPFSIFFIITGVFVALTINTNTQVVLKAYKICVILILCWSIVNYLSDNLLFLLHFGDDAENEINTTAIKFISNILKIVIIAFAVVMVISEMGYNINGLLTGIGVGGLAVSLAAQDAVSNLISGFIIVFEKPFIVGDLIQTATVQGFVEEVAMRSTKIRTLDDSVITVPNSTLTNDAITNISRMDKRLINIEIGLTYSTSNDDMKNCQQQIEQYLIDDADILPTPVRVNFSKLDSSSLNVTITCYTVKTDVNEYLKIINNLNYKIKEIVEENGLSFAFPTNSIYIENK